jgi:cytochrome c5
VVTLSLFLHKEALPMMKPKTLLPLMLVTLVVACSKQEPKAPPPPQAAAPAAAPAEAPPAAVPAAPEAAGAKVAQADDKGKKVYDSTCFACHAAGVAGAPKLSDKASWGQRIAQGMDTLYMHSLKGFQGKTGLMPPKGGNMSLADADVKAAVDYMVAQAK